MRVALAFALGWLVAMLTIVALVPNDASAAAHRFDNLWANRFSVGTITQRDLGTRPTCAAGYRGMIWQDANGAGVADTTAVCNKDASDAYAWRTLQ